ncbi:hypothetical protein B0T26DRAFT_745039 [Lasiosphaeria miniovina]|uniref:Uncharacterized protein n=1 Tax=Lasiosphaeria miniovina TaxID=1954250 RepID=A0AA40EC77_9PEZI|nr:uncharacterized protein B0T26DRAFT_745039 [Lasiosphaeria miniovina]KAK0732937.1 hypothetical protein B0T26DRAFT_745039 [Lasiosphaeria miniovina]
MCVATITADPIPFVTGFGVQCTGAGTAELQGRPRTRTLVPASVTTADGHSAFDVLVVAADHSACQDMQNVLQEFVADLETQSGLTPAQEA